MKLKPIIIITIIIIIITIINIAGRLPENSHNRFVDRQSKKKQ